MYLKRVEMTGFKSFPEKTRLDFQLGLTAVVGPNGSGKSNIADAVRWVMGEQSVKSLRGQKMEDVIFSGTEFRKPLGYAEVAMTVDNASRVLPLEFNEVTVARRVYRSGESAFLLNGTPCRLKDIQTLFMDTGVGREGYSIIGQGRIDEILSVRSEDRRMLFEEAAGIVKLKARRGEALSKLEYERNNLVRVGDLIEEIASQLEPMQEQAERAKIWLSLKEQYKTVQLNIFLDEAGKYGAERERLEKQISDLGAQTDGGRAQLDETRAASRAMKESSASADARYKEANERLVRL
ncbi:MAG: AAA family ATPase, partial [Defluviitaleaceae bacterium]|nr:AAA family ATPase [Defluviitaleaceae bacterium]